MLPTICMYVYVQSSTSTSTPFVLWLFVLCCCDWARSRVLSRTFCTSDTMKWRGSSAPPISKSSTRLINTRTCPESRRQSVCFFCNFFWWGETKKKRYGSLIRSLGKYDDIRWQPIRKVIRKVCHPNVEPLIFFLQQWKRIWKLAHLCVYFNRFFNCCRNILKKREKGEKIILSYLLKILLLFR